MRLETRDIRKQKVMRKADCGYERARKYRMRADKLRDIAKIIRSKGNNKNAEAIEYKAEGIDRKASSIEEKVRMFEARYGIVREQEEAKATTQAPPPPSVPSEPQPAKEIYVKEIIREVVRIKCSHCGGLADQTDKKCPNCNAPL